MLELFQLYLTFQCKKFKTVIDDRKKSQVLTFIINIITNIKQNDHDNVEIKQFHTSKIQLNCQNNENYTGL